MFCTCMQITPLFTWAASFGWLPRVQPFIHRIAYLAGGFWSEVNDPDWLIHKTHKCTVKGRVSTVTVQRQRLSFVEWSISFDLSILRRQDYSFHLVNGINPTLVIFHSLGDLCVQTDMWWERYSNWCVLLPLNLTRL